MKRGRTGKVFAALWLVVGYIGILFFLWYGSNYIDSDMASEIILSKLCARQHSMMSSDWYYSTELRLLNMQTVMIPLCAIFTNFKTIRLVSSAIIYVLVIVSYFYCCHQSGVKSKAVYFAPVFVTPFAYSYMKYDMVGLYYYGYSIVSFFSMGFILKINDSDVRKKDKVLPWVFYILLAFLIGLTTIRQLILFYYPMSLVLLILWTNDYIHKYGIRIISWDKIRDEIIKNWKQDRYLKYFVVSCVGSAVASVAYVLNVVWLRKVYNFHSYDRLLFSDISDFKELSEVIVGHIRIFGYTPDVQFISVDGIANVLSLLFVVCVVLVVRTIFKSFEKYDIKSRIVTAYFVCATAFNAFIFIFSTLYGERYMLPYMLFFTIVLAIFMDKSQTDISIKKAMYVFFCVVFILNGILQYRNLYEEEKDNGRNEVAQFLVDKGYDFGYATFWNANVFTELTNGAVEIRNVQRQEWYCMGYEHWLMEKRNENRVCDHPVFILMDYEQYAENQDLEFLDEKYRVYDGGGYMVFEYADTDTLYSMVQTED